MDKAREKVHISIPNAYKVMVIDDSIERYTFFDKFFKNNIVDHIATSDLAIQYIPKVKPDVIMLDGDLGDKDSGVCVARFLSNHEHGYELKQVVIISVNAPKAKEMSNLLEFGNINHRVIPFTSFV